MIMAISNSRGSCLTRSLSNETTSSFNQTERQNLRANQTNVRDAHNWSRREGTSRKTNIFYPELIIFYAESPFTDMD